MKEHLSSGAKAHCFEGLAQGLKPLPTKEKSKKPQDPPSNYEDGAPTMPWRKTRLFT